MNTAGIDDKCTSAGTCAFWCQYVQARWYSSYIIDSVLCMQASSIAILHRPLKGYRLLVQGEAPTGRNGLQHTS